MKVRKTLKNKNTQKNAVVYEHDRKVIVDISDYGVVIDNTAIEKKEFDSISEYEKFEKEFAPTSVTVTGAFKKVRK